MVIIHKGGHDMLIAALLLATIVLLSFCCFRKVFYYPLESRAKPEDPLRGKQYKKFEDDIRHITKIMQSLPFEAITIESFDGTTLFGRYYHVRDGAPVQIMFHGYQSCAFRDCSGGHALSRKMGFNCLVVDQRAHGNSGGTVITYGIKERKDCLCWIRYAKNRFGRETALVLSGISMGAATILMASDLPDAKNVACIVADSPYSSPAAIIRKVCIDRHYPAFLVMPLIQLGALLFGHFRLSESSAVTSVSGTYVPVLLIHGDADGFVPCEMSWEIAAACRSRVSVEIFPDAGHGLSYLVDPVRYELSVLNFYQSIPALSQWIDPDYIEEITKMRK